MIRVTVNNRGVQAIPLSPVTVGAEGIVAAFLFSDDWAGLAKTAIFKGSGEEVEKIVLNNECTVPPEVLAEAGGMLQVGVYGNDGHGTTIRPTVWGVVGRIEDGAISEDAGQTGTTPSWAAQLQNAVQEAITTANNAVIAAEENADDSEAWAVGTRDGEAIPETDPAYQNYAKYGAERAAASAAEGAESAATASGKANEAAASAGTASNKAGEAATSASNAATSAEAANTAKTAAQNAQTAAEQAKAGAERCFVQFRKPGGRIGNAGSRQRVRRSAISNGGTGQRKRGRDERPECCGVRGGGSDIRTQCRKFRIGGGDQRDECGQFRNSSGRQRRKRSDIRTERERIGDGCGKLRDCGTDSAERGRGCPGCSGDSGCFRILKCRPDRPEHE